MIMSLKSRTSFNTPIFHVVDMDWQEDGFIFQFSEDLAEEAEITINTLLPLLKHYFPTADPGCNFTQDAEDRCQTMVWDDMRKMVIDTANNETAQIGDEEELVGFVFDADVSDTLANLGRPSQQNMPGDNDSVSTFRSLQDIRVSNSQSSSHTAAPSTSSVASPSTLTASSTAQQSADSTLDLKLQQLTSQITQQQQQFTNLQTMFTQYLSAQQNSSSSDANTSNAGGVNVPSGSEL